MGSQPTGYWTKYTYDAINDLLTVSQNAQPNGTLQTRTYTYDLLGRMASEQNPETNGAAYSYTYDIGTTCGTSKGNLVKRVDALSPPTVTCYAYDLLHRPTSVTYSGGYAGVTPSKHYVYDSATVNGQPMTNAANRLAEAYAGSTDLGFSYTNRGEVSDAWQSTPNSGGYYHDGQLLGSRTDRSAQYPGDSRPADLDICARWGRARFVRGGIVWSEPNYEYAV
jgi:hypothetical protein